MTQQYDWTSAGATASAERIARFEDRVSRVLRDVAGGRLPTWTDPTAYMAQGRDCLVFPMGGRAFATWYSGRWVMIHETDLGIEADAVTFSSHDCRDESFQIHPIRVAPSVYTLTEVSNRGRVRGGAQPFGFVCTNVWGADSHEDRRVFYPWGGHMVWETALSAVLQKDARVLPHLASSPRLPDAYVRSDSALAAYADDLSVVRGLLYAHVFDVVEVTGVTRHDDLVSGTVYFRHKYTGEHATRIVRLEDDVLDCMSDVVWSIYDACRTSVGPQPLFRPVEGIGVTGTEGALLLSGMTTDVKHTRPLLCVVPQRCPITGILSGVVAQPYCAYDSRSGIRRNAFDRGEYIAAT